LAVKRSKAVTRGLNDRHFVVDNRSKSLFLTTQRLGKCFPDVLIAWFVIAEMRMKQQLLLFGMLFGEQT